MKEFKEFLSEANTFTDLTDWMGHVYIGDTIPDKDNFKMKIVNISLNYNKTSKTLEPSIQVLGPYNKRYDYTLDQLNKIIKKS